MSAPLKEAEIALLKAARHYAAVLESEPPAMRVAAANEELRERAIRAAGLACIRWVTDTGDCHFCSPSTERQHEEYCPLRFYFRRLRMAAATENDNGGAR